MGANVSVVAGPISGKFARNLESPLLAPNDYSYLTPYATQAATTQAGVKNWVVGTMAASYAARNW